MSFLSEAANHDPENALAITQRIISHAALNPYKLHFTPIEPRYVCIYSDANHSIKSLRGHWGCVIQLQESDVYESQKNVIYWTSGRLAKLYDSVYAAELKAARNSLVEF